MAQVTVVAGPARSGKTTALLERYRHGLTTLPIGASLWLAPNSRSASEVRAALLSDSLTACLSPQVLTFAQFAESVLASVREPSRLINPGMKRQLLREILVEEQSKKRLKHFGSVAQSGGALDIFCGLISDLKRLEVWPEDLTAACKAAGMSSKDREILNIYTKYQDLLLKHRLYDTEGRFWLAHEELRRGESDPLKRLKFVVADGFTDFTRTQYDILKLLADRVEELVITLPLEPQPCRQDLFAKSLRTLQQLREQFPQLKQQQRKRNAAHLRPSIAHIEQQLFGDPRNPQTAATTDGIEILASSGGLGEIEQLAGRIKELLVIGDGDGPVPPSDIVLVFRSMAEAAPLVQEVFTERGIPFSMSADRPASKAPVIAALINLLRLQGEDWPYRRLLAVLGNRYFRPRWREWTGDESLAAIERVVRHLQIPRGSQPLLDAVRSLADRRDAVVDEPAAEEDESYVRRWSHRASEALTPLMRLKSTLDALPAAVTACEWVEALENLAQETGLIAASAAHETATSADDRIAWDALKRSLQDTDRLAKWMNRPRTKISRADLLEHLLDVAGNTAISSAGDEAGRVRIISAPSARGLNIPYLFLAGLSEKAFPRPERDGGLYSETEYQRMNGHGLWFPLRAERGQEEMLLFYDVVTRAQKRLYLSYPAVDDKAQPLLPSSYLTELERACGDAKITRHEAPDLSPIPNCESPRGPAEWRVLALSQAVGGDGASFTDLIACNIRAGLAPNITAGIDLIDKRGPGAELGEFEGVIQSDAAKEKLAQRYGNDRCWSASQLEQYARCPYQFFLSKVLKLEPLPELALEIDYLARGRILHATLAALHRTVNETALGFASPLSLGKDELDSLYIKTLNELVDRPASNPLTAALREVDRRLLSQWAQLYFQQHELYDSSWNECDSPLRPAYFEVSFGSDRDLESADPISTKKPYQIKHAGETVTLSGRVDRIDVGCVAGQPVFNIVDYKTGSAGRLSRDAIEAGLALQLPLYAIAVQEMILSDQQVVPWRVGYWYVKSHGYRDRDALKLYQADGDAVAPSEDWQSLRQSILDRVVSFVRGIRSAQFPVFSADEHCTSMCDFRTVCRIGQVRALEKVWRAPDAPVVS